MTDTKVYEGMKAIGEAMGLPWRRVQQLHNAGMIPTFKLGGSVAITRIALQDWLADLQAKATAA